MLRPLLSSLVLLLPALLSAQADSAARRAKECPSCAEWNAPQKPFRLYGNTYFVGTRGLSAILVTSDRGHVLLDAGLPESAKPIMANIRELGFKVEDIKLIVNSHAHYDHAGGIAELQRVSRGEVVATAPSAKMMERGRSSPDDPQYGLDLPYAPVASVGTITDGEIVRGGSVSLTAHRTAGHTPGGTTWTWQSCEGDRCLDFVYADSQTPVSADSFLFTKSTTYPTAISDFEHGFRALEQLRCDVLVTPHPGASRLFERVEARALADQGACRQYAATARQRLAERVAKERGAR